jgi:hypothetical protein
MTDDGVRKQITGYSINHKGTETKKGLEKGMNIRSRKRRHSLYRGITKMMRKRRRKEIIILQY